MKILIVDDNVSDLKLAHSVLAYAGHEVTEAHSAEQAAEILRTQVPQVILIDLDLPLMDGLTMTRKLKEASETSGIPVIAMTSYPDNFPERSTRSAGFAAYLIKPINTRTLSRQIAEALKHN